MRTASLRTPDVPIHRGDWIRTSGLLLPKQARYQTALRPVCFLFLAPIILISIPAFIKVMKRMSAHFVMGFDSSGPCLPIFKLAQSVSIRIGLERSIQNPLPSRGQARMGEKPS